MVGLGGQSKDVIAFYVSLESHLAVQTMWVYYCPVNAGGLLLVSGYSCSSFLFELLSFKIITTILIKFLLVYGSVYIYINNGPKKGMQLPLKIQIKVIVNDVSKN